MENLGDVVFLHDVARIHHFELLLLSDVLSLQIGAGRWKALQSPFLIWDALQSAITVGDNLLLPSFLCFLPFRPGLGGFLVDFVEDASLTGRLGSDALTEDEGLPGRQRQQEYAHSSSALWYSVGQLHALKSRSRVIMRVSVELQKGSSCTNTENRRRGSLLGRHTRS